MSVMNINVLDPAQRAKFIAERKARSESNSSTPTKSMSFNVEEECFLARMMKSPSRRQTPLAKPRPRVQIPAPQPSRHCNEGTRRLDFEASTSEPIIITKKPQQSIPHPLKPVQHSAPRSQSVGALGSSGSSAPYKSIMNVNIMDPTERAKFIAERNEIAQRQSIAYLQSVADNNADMAAEDPALRSALRHASVVESVLSELKIENAANTPKRAMTMEFNAEEECFLARVRQTPCNRMTPSAKLHTRLRPPQQFHRPSASADENTDVKEPIQGGDTTPKKSVQFNVEEECFLARVRKTPAHRMTPLTKHRSRLQPPQSTQRCKITNQRLDFDASIPEPTITIVKTEPSDAK